MGNISCHRHTYYSFLRLKKSYFTNKHMVYFNITSVLAFCNGIYFRHKIVIFYVT